MRPSRVPSDSSPTFFCCAPTPSADSRRDHRALASRAKQEKDAPTSGAAGPNAKPTHSRVVWLVDADPKRRAACKRELARAGFAVRCFADAESVRARYAARGGAPAGVVIAVRPPGMGALALGARLRERDAHLPIIFITAPHLARSETKRMHAIGQMVLPHRFRPAQLVDSVRRAIAATSSAPKPQVLPDPLDGALKLTPRERQVLALRLRGLAVKEVARQLGIATGTVGTHCQRLLRKYRVRSLTEFVLRHVIARTWPRR